MAELEELSFGLSSHILNYEAKLRLVSWDKDLFLVCVCVTLVASNSVLNTE